MQGFIVVSVDKKALKKMTSIQSDSIKYTPVISQTENSVEKAFINEFPGHHLLFAMPIAEIKKHISIIDKLLF